jgi:phenylpropionate dioxygenase-like ring-hydroxylating dioxygenase large terminal subunit
MTTISQLGFDAAAIDAELAGGWTLPTRFYSDPGVFELEMDDVYATGWHVFGSLHKLQEPGDHIVGLVGKVPIVVTRDREGGLNALLNICRHRAYAVATEDGRRSNLQCRYHAWTYGLDGSLRSAPRCEMEPHFDKSRLGLLRASIDTWNGLVFVNPQADAAPLRQSYPELDGYLADWDLGFEGWNYVDGWKFEIPVNWKAWVENSTECYHCPTIHTQSFSDAFDVSKEYLYFDHGKLMAQRTPFKEAKNWSRPEEDAGQVGAGFRFLYFFPGSSFVKDDYVVMANRFIPTSAESCDSYVDIWVRPGLDADFVEQWMEMHRKTLEEDVVAMVGQQPGLRAGLLPNGRLLTTSESAIHNFHLQLWSELKSASTVGVPS